jgi:hypothetical protein
MVCAAEITRRFPQIISVSVHPGVVTTDLVNNLSAGVKDMTYGANWLTEVIINGVLSFNPRINGPVHVGFSIIMTKLVFATM